MSVIKRKRVSIIEYISSFFEERNSTHHETNKKITIRNYTSSIARVIVDTGDLEVERNANASVGYDVIGAGLGKNEKETMKCDEERIVSGIENSREIQVEEVNLRRGGDFRMSLFIKSGDKWVYKNKDEILKDMIDTTLLKRV